jgi:XRE family transcriptional regulator, aerobic/anaerobic benzoate catabolism transcriptional regulator
MHGKPAGPARSRAAQVAVSSRAHGNEPAAPLANDESDPKFLAGVGKRVREARARGGMARKTLSQVARVSERYLAQLEAGDGNASIVLLRRVAAALNVRLAELLEQPSLDGTREAVGRFLESLPQERMMEALHRLQQDFGSDESVRRKRIALIGLRGAGKTTLGTLLARALGREFIELDREVERDAGVPLSEVFLLYGSAGYHLIERRCLERAIESQSDIVLAVGGGIVSESDTFDVLLRNCYAIWIKASPEEHMARVLAQGDTRPMAGRAQAMDDLRRILGGRQQLYGKADAVVDTAGQPIDQSLRALQALMIPA